MDNDRFHAACQAAANAVKGNGIGTLGEKTLHAVLKYFYEPCAENHELRVGSYFADIFHEDEIFEIQTRGFEKLRKKLDAFLPQFPVTIIYPVAHTKWLSWVDQETGEITKKRKSPKQGSAYEVFFEMYKIKQWLTDPNLRFRILLMDMEEYRNLDGWSDNKKRGSSRQERIPVAVKQEVCIDCLQDYRKIVPDGLPKQFTTGDFRTASRLSLGRSQTALNVLHHVGGVRRIGKKGRAYLYEQV